jgi:subtilase family serine protease
MDYHGGAALPGASTPDDKSIDQEIGIETALDVDMASAACPACRILEVQIPHSATPTAPKDPSQPPDYDGYADAFGTAAQTAIAHGAAAISMSYGLPGDDHMLHSAVASQLAHRGVAIVAASGDAGFQATQYLWPQALPTVTAVGGTELVKESGHFSEGAWSSGGSSCVPSTAPPTGQQALLSTSMCAGARASVDVSAAADNLAIYDNYSPAANHPIGWTVVAGTSAAAPFIAGLYAATGYLGDVLGPNTLYSLSPAKFHDITSGGNGAITNGRCVSNSGPTAEDGSIKTYDSRLCSAGPGWDGPTGLGSPRGLLGP